MVILDLGNEMLTSAPFLCPDIFIGMSGNENAFGRYHHVGFTKARSSILPFFKKINGPEAIIALKPGKWEMSNKTVDNQVLFFIEDGEEIAKNEPKCKPSSSFNFTQLNNGQVPATELNLHGSRCAFSGICGTYRKSFA